MFFLIKIGFENCFEFVLWNEMGEYFLVYSIKGVFDL